MPLNKTTNPIHYINIVVQNFKFVNNKGGSFMNKVYEEYKIINVNEIEGARVHIKDKRIKEAIIRAENNIIRYGFKSPFEVEKTGNKYRITAGKIHFIAAKNMGYEEVPCLVRNRAKEAILFKLFKKYSLNV